MRRSKVAALPVAIGVLPIALFLVLQTGFVPDPRWGGPGFHFYIVSFTAFVAALVAAVIVLASSQVRDARVFFLGMAFLGMAGIFFVHALTTPGVLVQNVNPWVGLSAKLSLFTGAAFLLLSAFDARSRLHFLVVQHQKRLLIIFSGTLMLYGAVAITTSIIGPEPLIADMFRILSSGALSRVTAALTIGMLVYVIGRYAWLHRVYRSPLVSGLLVSTILLVQALISMEFGPLWHLSWWMYHILMLAAFMTAVVALVREYRMSGGLQGVVDGLLLRGTIAQMQRGYNDAIVALVGAVEARDPYTRGHSDQVANLSLSIGQHLCLSQQELRTLHQSALLHDIGKIGIPDSILNKSGKLTDEEFQIVKEHPARGHEIIRSVRSLQEEIAGIRHHHERLDGSGYPDGLRGTEISLFARIIAVADVFDALTSERPYRPAYSVRQSLEIIDADTPHKLDRVVVRALHSIVGQEARGPVKVNTAVPVYAH